MREDKQYRVIRMSLQNYMGIEAIELAPDGKSIVISGPNEVGKTTLLNAVYAAITGKAPNVSEPVKQGTDQAVISVDLGNATIALRIVRKFGKGESVVVENADGSRLKSPATVLSALYSTIAVDPLAFAGERPKEQAAVLRSIVKLNVDPEQVLAEIATAEEQRRDAGRDLRQAQGHLASEAEDAPQEDPGPRKSAADIAARRQAEQKKTETKRRATELARYATEETAAAVESVECVTDRIVTLRAELARLEAELEQLVELATASSEKSTKRTLEARELPDGDFAAVDSELAAMQKHNESVQAWEALKDAQESTNECAVKYAELDDEVKSLRASLQAALAGAEYPVEGMSLSEDLETVLYDGVPLSQTPTSVQLLVGVQVAVAQNPQLRVLRVQHGNDLDAAHQEALFALAKEHGFQVWLETVANGGGLQFTLQE